MRKDYPAYARTIAQHIVRGEKPTSVGVLLSSKWWDLYNHVARVCIRPDDWAPGRFEFGYLQGLHVVAVSGDCTQAQLGELVLDLMRARPSLLWVFDMSGAAIVAESVPDPRRLAQWAGEMAGCEAAVSNAWKAYQAGIEALARRELEEIQRITERSGEEAAALWAAERMGWPDLVRQQYSLQLQESGAAQPA